MFWDGFDLALLEGKFRSKIEHPVNDWYWAYERLHLRHAVELAEEFDCWSCFLQRFS